MTLKLHSQDLASGIQWVNLKERMKNGKSHLEFTFARILGVREFGCGY